MIVGAGLAGLSCARSLQQKGFAVRVFEEDHVVGGKVRTDLVDGFRLDRGFQVYFEGYPHCQQVLDQAELRFGAFEAGARVRWDGRWFTVSQARPLETLRSGLLPLADLARMLLWSRELGATPFDQIWEGNDLPARELLRRRGFSEAFLERFAAPFFGGIFLDRTLSGSGQALAYVWKVLQQGRTVIPAEGMEALPRQLVGRLAPETVTGGTAVRGLVRDASGAVTGVTLASGETVEAAQVVLATDPVTLAQLAGVTTPEPAKASTCVTFDVDALPEGGRPILYLRGNGEGQVNEVVPVTAVCPEAAPAGRHLVSATVLGLPGGTESSVALEVRYELEAWFPDLNVRGWRPLSVVRLPRAQMAQPPGFRTALPKADSGGPGLVLAGEGTAQASLDGAVESGLRAADLVAARLAATVASGDPA